MDSGSGFGVIFGSRYTKGALELGYHRSTHDTNSLFVDIGKQDATYNLVDLNLKYDVFAKGKFRPNILLGVGYTWVTVNNSMTDGDNYSDETFTGGALNLGGGISYYLNPRWCINTEVIYRWQRYGRVEGVDLESALSGSGINYTVGIAYTF